MSLSSFFSSLVGAVYADAPEKRQRKFPTSNRRRTKRKKSLLQKIPWWRSKAPKRQKWI